MKSVLLTRSDTENDLLMLRLQESGYETLSCNLIKYELQKVDEAGFKRFKQIIVTSSFAANNAPPAHSKGVSAWAVGKKSAKILASKGYEIRFVAPSAESLKDQFVEDTNKPTLYLSSNYITIDMPFFVTRCIFYKVTYQDSLTEQQIARYKNGVDYILLYSENSAKTFLKLVKENNLLHCLENSTIITISSKISKVLADYFKTSVVCNGTDLILEYLKSK
ncbi:MAG: hypothetical protein COA94_00070 [Rickettsiales bacterium]|nr:MAG: hypothetical protein COA94_00070 [Rickettsiales bacterium]